MLPLRICLSPGETPKTGPDAYVNTPAKDAPEVPGDSTTSSSMQVTASTVGSVMGPLWASSPAGPLGLLQTATRGLRRKAECSQYRGPLDNKRVLLGAFVFGTGFLKAVTAGTMAH